MKEKNFEFPILSIDKIEFNAVNRWIIAHEYLFKNTDLGLYIFGAGIRGNLMLELLENSSIPCLGFIDNSIVKQGGRVKNYRIFSLDSILNRLENNKILISAENHKPIEEKLLMNGLKRDEDYFVIENKIYTKFIENYFGAYNSEYIAFGDCFFTDSDVDDINSDSFAECLNKKYEDRISVLSVHGLCIPGFYYLMKELIKDGCKPKAVAFIVNIPFCNSIQTKLPQSQHADLFKMIRDSLDSPSKEFMEYVSVAEERSKNIGSGSFSTSNVRDSAEVEKVLTRTRYMYKLNRNNENIIYMEKMIDLLNDNNIRSIPFIPSINFNSGRTIFGEIFIEKYKEICREICSVAKLHNAEVLDMSFLLDKDYFLGDKMTKFPSREGRELETKSLMKALESM